MAIIVPVTALTALHVVVIAQTRVRALVMEEPELVEAGADIPPIATAYGWVLPHRYIMKIIFGAILHGDPGKQVRGFLQRRARVHGIGFRKLGIVQVRAVIV